MADVIYVGQNIAKDCVVGDRHMNRYGIFNGLERPRRVDSNLAVTILGVEAAADPTGVVLAGGVGNLSAGWYAWVAVYASATYVRSVPVADGSGNYTRGNPSSGSVALNPGVNTQVNVTVPAIAQAGITHILLYRSLASATQAQAEAGPFFYTEQAVNAGAAVVILDNTADAALGVEVEQDNLPPNAYRYAINADSYILTGGNYPIGIGLTCTVTPGSNLVTADSGGVFYDGIIGWHFKCLDDKSGGTNNAGLYFANFIDGQTLQLVDGSNNPIAYDGDLSGAGQTFSVYLPGFVLRWSKKGEPESYPLENLINFEGDITGIAQIPNQPLILVCTDEPRMWILDLNLINTDSFKQNKLLLSTEFTASSHYSLIPVEGRLRAIDAHQKTIIETDGSSVVDITSDFVPKVFDYLSNDWNQIKLWHCAYDEAQHLFAAFVTFQGSHRLIDFAICQHLVTKGWFFNLEKDLLSSANYLDYTTGEAMILGGTEGPGDDRGGVWGRIWYPNIYSEWIPEGSLLSGTITGVTDGQTFNVDTSTNALFSSSDGLAGRWVLVCDANGEYAQLGYINTNTSDQISVNRVINGLDLYSFYPVPEIGWKFYLGMIECRWGPKLYDFGDPDVVKKVWEVWMTVHNHNESDPPFIRLYRGYEQGYAEQLSLTERLYLDRTTNQSLVNKVSNKLEQVPRWGVAFYDRSYGPTTLHSITIVFTPEQPMAQTR